MKFSIPRWAIQNPVVVAATYVGILALGGDLLIRFARADDALSPESAGGDRHDGSWFITHRG